MKNSEYKTGFKVISVPFNEKNIQDTKTKIEFVKFMHLFLLSYVKLTYDFCSLSKFRSPRPLPSPLSSSPPTTLGYIRPTRKVKCRYS